MHRRVAQAEGAALADAEYVYCVDVMTTADDIHATVYIAVDIVVEVKITVGPVRVAPVDQVHVESCFQQSAHGGAVLLQVGHVGAIDQCINDQQWNTVLHFLRVRLETVQHHLVLMVNGFLRRDAGWNVTHLHQVLQPVAELLAEVGEFLECLVGADLYGNHGRSSLFSGCCLAGSGFFRSALFRRGGLCGCLLRCALFRGRTFFHRRGFLRRHR